MTGYDPEFGEPDEISTENVVELLRRYDQELLLRGKIEPEETEAYLLGTYSEVPMDPELVEAEARAEIEGSEWENFSRLIRSTLTVVGLADPSSVVPENVMAVDQELLEQIDPYTIESLFFEVAKKVHARLGPYEPVTWRRLLEQAKPANREVRDLDQLQSEQRLDAFGYLVKLGINANQIGDMVKSSNEMGVAAPSRRQNVNRMAYYLEEEPFLEELVADLQKRARKRERLGGEALSAEHVIRMSQVVLRFVSERLEVRKQKQASLPYGNDKQWDSIDQDVYKKAMRRIKTSLAISYLIMAEMQINSTDEFLDTIE